MDLVGQTKIVSPSLPMKEDLIWHDFDRLDRILRVAFVNDDSIAVFKYQLCPCCGVTMEPSDAGNSWICNLCGGRVKN